MPWSRAPFLAALAAAAALAAGCGGGSDADSGATAWADGVCKAVTDWTEAFERIGEELGGARSADALQLAVTDVKDATTTFADDLRALGRPEIEAGDKAEATLDTLRTELTGSVEAIQDAVSGVSGLAGLAQAGTKIATALNAMQTSIQTAFTELEGLDAKGELEQAFEDADSCDALTQRSSS